MSPPQTIAHYRITAKLGEGGMGEVYRATDTKLGREVAIKVLPDSFAADPDRLARFTREAQVLAALNHPNIAAIYGVEDRALIMELLEGATVASRLASGPLDVEEALPIARQIAEALEAAHEKGITHRDLKPANVMITGPASGQPGVVKVLDFGLAAVAQRDPASASANATNSPTLTMAATQVGVLLGTAGYMSPEQAAGKPADKRADIWSFGVLLYEMLTGRRLFEGETMSHTLADVLRAPIDFDRLPAQAPAPIRDLLRRCLDRDLRTRLRDIGEARIAIQKWLANPVSAETAPSPSRLGWAASAVAVVAIAIAAALAFVHFREKPPVAELIRFQIPLPEKSSFLGGPFLSPDGRRVAFHAAGPGGRGVLWIRPLDSLESRPLTGTEGLGNSSFWSPDSRFLGFEVQGKLKKLEAAGGPPQTVCDFAGPWMGGAWSRAGTIIFAAYAKGLMQVPEAGGPATPLTTVDPLRKETAHFGPVFLPDGRHFLYARFSGLEENNGIYLGSLDSNPSQQNSRRLLATSSAPIYAPAADPGARAGIGHLLFEREGTLMAQPFDERKLELAGDAVPVAEAVASASGRPNFSASDTGVLAYWSGGSLTRPITQLTWFNREGKPLGGAGEPGVYNSVVLSPDGSRVAADRRDTQNAGAGGLGSGNVDIWLIEFVHGTSSRFTFDPAWDWLATWSPDGSRIVFSSGRDGPYNLYRKVASGAGNEELLFKSGEAKYAQDWSADGKFLLYSVGDGQVGSLSLWVLPLEGDRKPVPYLNGQFDTSQGRFSPDGRFVAYASNESGKSEVYVQPFPEATGGKWMVSKGGGSQPRWRRDGKELFYVSADSQMMAVEVSLNPAFQHGNPKALFHAPILGGGGFSVNVTRYDVTADGKRFLINTVPDGVTPAAAKPITVVLNWTAGLRK